MTTNQEINYLGNFIQNFEGVYACDKIPNLKRFKKALLIINLDHHYERGSHFVALIIDKSCENKIVYFDPLGFNLNNKHIIKTISSISDDYNQITKAIQAPLSNFCGLFCLAACVSNFLKTPLNTFMNLFSSNLQKNDKIVFNYLKNFYKSINK